MPDIPERFKIKTLAAGYLAVMAAYGALQRMLTPEGQQYITTIKNWTAAAFAAITLYSQRAEALEAEAMSLRAENDVLRQQVQTLRQENRVLEDVLGVKLELTEEKK